MVVTPIRSRTASCSEKWGNHSVPQLVRAECDQLAFGERARHCPDRRRSRGCVPCGSPPAGRDGGRGSVCPWTPRSRHVWPGASHTTIPLPRSAAPRGACAAARGDRNVWPRSAGGVVVRPRESGPFPRLVGVAGHVGHWTSDDWKRAHRADDDGCAGSNDNRVMRISRGQPLTSALQEPHLQSTAPARSGTC